MLYCSSRGEAAPVSAAEAIKTGLSPDGGLFVPGETVKLENPGTLVNMNYRELAVHILGKFLTGFTGEELGQDVKAAYGGGKFDVPEIAPVHSTPRGGPFFLELWHGPTCAFKDMALQLLPHLLVRSAEKTGEKSGILILVATSGDTGKAALEGFRDVPGTKIAVFYPEEGVSEMQKRQMITQEGNNVYVIAVKGNFDDAQSGVKAIFADNTIKDKIAENGYRFSSANSINWGRLVPQIVYYYSAYLGLLRDGTINRGEPVNFVVPTGNFGNILAGFYARQAGLPVNRLICASNRNNVLTGFINTGTYNRNRDFVRTISPSMDILVSSNLERLLFEITGRDAEQVSHWMKQLNQSGSYEIDAVSTKTVNEIFWSDFADDTETVETIRRVYREYSYPVDTHTAVGAAVYEKYRAATGDTAKTIIVSTASPFKFNKSVARALLGENRAAGKTEFELLEMLSEKTGIPVPAGLRNLDKKPVLHTAAVTTDRMADAILTL